MQKIKEHTLGIDIGSTTVKVAILDDTNTVLFSDYKRHYANIQETLLDIIKDAFNKLGKSSKAACKMFIFDEKYGCTGTEKFILN